MKTLSVGIDEAGIGTLAGPMAVGIVVIPKIGVLPGVKDSKKMTDASREAVIDLIHEKALYHRVVIADVEWIDKDGVWDVWLRLVAGLILDVRCVFPRCEVLLDGNRLIPGIDYVKPIVGGDAIIESISAASVLAKYGQCCAMDDIHKEYPQYGFNSHRGYGTPEHLDALRRYGPCLEHRKSYKPVSQFATQHAGLRRG
jgi:ribonuclease HII